MNYEDLPADVQADLPQMMKDIADGKRTAESVAQEILSRI